MDTVIERDHHHEAAGNGMGFLLGVILLLFVAILFFVYGLPYISNFTQQQGPQINVPGKIDVNVNMPK